MAHRIKKACTKYWSHNWTALEFILKLAGYRQEGNGVEYGWAKGNHAYWFCDDGTVEYIEVPASEL